jgi:PmbA protein
VAELVVKEGLKLGFEEVAISISKTRAKQVRFSNNEVTVTQNWDKTEASVLASRDRRMVLGWTSDLSRQGLKSLLEKLSRNSRFIKEHESYAPLPEGPFSYASIQGLYDPRVAEVDAVELVKRGISATCESGNESASGTLLAYEEEHLLQTSRAVKASHKKSALNIMIRASVGTGKEKSYGMGNSCSTKLEGFKPEKAGREAGELARLSRKVVKVPEGRYDVVFARPAAGTLLDSLASMMSAFFVDSGASFLVDKVGQEVFSSLMSIHDDPLMPGGLGSRPYDEEGLPTRTNVLVDRGRLTTYLHNRLTAKKFRAEPTANAGWIVPAAWNLHVEAGDYGEEELIKEVEEGIFINNATYLRFHDYRSGDFSSVVRDGVFKIEKGELMGSVKGFRLSDNMQRMFKDVIGLSDKAEQVFHWWMETGVPVVTPLMAVRDVNFTSLME